METQKTKLLRKLLATPFLIMGSILFKVGEFVCGEKHTYRSEEVIAQIVPKMVCSKCGHTGNSVK